MGFSDDQPNTEDQPQNEQKSEDERSAVPNSEDVEKTEKLDDIPEPENAEKTNNDTEKIAADKTLEAPEENEEPDQLAEEDSIDLALKMFKLPQNLETDALELLRNLNFRMWTVDSMESIAEVAEDKDELPEEDIIDEAEEIRKSEAALQEQPSEGEIIEDIDIHDIDEKVEEEESDISIKSGDFVYVKEEKVVVEEVKEVVVEIDPRIKFMETCLNYGITPFLTEVVNNVVDTCEYVDEDEILRGKLDSNKLLQCLYEKYTILQIQQRKRFLLNKKVADYFRRKKNLRAITDDPPDNFMNEIRRYRDSLQNLDELKTKEAKTSAIVEEKLSILTNQLEDLKEQLALKIEKLNMHIREIGITTHYKKNSQLINEKLVDYYIRKMNNMRKEISKIRFHIIQQQHTIGVLQDKSKKLEELGDGLKMVEYEQLQTETLALAEKIEERNNELSKLRLRCNADTHIIAHIKEKQEMLAHKISLEQNVLNHLIDEQSECRAYVHDLKVQRDAIRKRYNILSYKCGLLDKPQLLYDYDVTSTEIQNIQEEISALKAEKESLLAQIEKYEELTHKF